MRTTPYLLVALSLVFTACVGGSPNDKKDSQDTDLDTDSLVDPDATPVVVVSPADPRTADDLVASVSNALADATYTWSWSVNGAAQADLRAETVPSARTRKGDNWCVSVLATRGGEPSGPTMLCTIIQNTAPTATVNLLPEDASASTDVSVLAVTADEDGDLVTMKYTWTWQFEGTSGLFAGIDDVLGADKLRKGQVITVTGIPTDGQDDGEPATDSLTIRNSAPVVLSASLTPQGATTNSTVTAAVSASDPDGDGSLRYAYQWFRNAPPAIAGSVGDTLNGAKFDKDDEIWFEVVVSDRDDSSLPFESEHLIIADTPPQLGSVVLTPNPAGAADTLTCTAGGWTDADGDTEAYRYQWTINSTPVSGATGATLASAFVKGQSVYCSATPFDGQLEGSSLPSNTVIIGNTPPVIDGVVLNSNSPALTDTLSANIVNPHDIDGDTPITYSYQWYIRTTPVPAPKGTAATINGGFLPGDRVTVRVTPSDGVSVGSPVTSNIAVVGNNLPTMTSVTLAPLPAYVTDALVATAVGTDLDGHTVTYKHRWRVNGTLVQDSASPRLAAGAFSRGDSVQDSVTPNDGFADGLPRTAGPIIIANSAPVLGGVTLGPSPAYEATTLTCAPSGFTDADGDTGTYTYQWTVGGALIAPTTATLTGTYFSRGATVRCFVTASDGLTTSAQVGSPSLTISNTKPTLESATISPATPRTGDTLSLVTTGAADADGDTVTFLVEWTVDSVVVAGGPTLAPTRFHPGSRIVARVTPNDGIASGTAVLTPEIVVSNSNPTISAFTVTPQSPRASDTLTTALTASDPDGDTLTPSYVWTVNGVVDAAQTASSYSVANAHRGDRIVVTVTVSDGHGGTASAAAAPVVVLNSAPVVGSVVITPGSATEVTTLTCEASGVVDPDGDTLQLFTEWRVNGAVAGTTDTLTGSAFRRDDGVMCSVRAGDGTDFSTQVSSQAVIIANTPPVLASAVIAEPSPYASSVLVVNTGVASDIDADTVTLLTEWYINDAYASTGVSLMGSFVRGDSVYAVVTPTDGTDFGAALTTDPVEILNAVPSVLSVIIGPSSPTQGDTLVANVITSDADEDPLTYVYEWYVDDAVVQSGDVGTLAPGPFTTGSNVRVVVVADDGLDESAPQSSGTITVGNAAPSITAVNITPSPILETSIPTCVPVGWFDIDGDPEGYLYKWRVNGVARSVNASINGLIYKRGDTLVCEVTPYDGHAYGTPVSSAPVTVVNAPPTLGSVNLSLLTPRESDTLTTYITGVTDPDGDPVTTTVSWYVNDALVRVAATLNGTYFDKGQSIRAVVQLSDGVATASFNTENALAINTLPRVLTVTIAPGSPTVLDPIVATYSTYDPDPADTVTVAWKWTVAAAVVAGQTTTTLPAGVARKNQQVYISGTPSDGDSTGVTVNSPAVDVINSRPTVGTVTIEDPLDAGVGARCTSDGASDADGDPVNVVYSWQINGLSGPVGSPMIGSFFKRGDSIVCRATPEDGQQTGSIRVSEAKIAGNARPTLDFAVLSASPPTEADTLSVMLVGALDADNDILIPSYEWLVNGVVVSIESLLTSDRFSRGDTVQARVTLSDGLDASVPTLSALETVANTPPRVTNVPTLSPNPVFTDGTVTANGLTGDLDGDTVTLRWDWYVNDVLKQSGASKTFSGTFFSKGDVIYAWALPNDGVEDGVAVRSELGAVTNTPPTVPTVSVSPTSPSPNVDAVVCSISTPSVDLDNDPIGYTFRWRVNGTNIGQFTSTATTSTLGAQWVIPNATIVCEAAAHDDEATTLFSQGAVALAGYAVQEGCRELRAIDQITNGYYVIDPDRDTGPIAPYEVYCEQQIDGGGWTRILRTEGSNIDFGQATYNLVTSYASARSTTGVYEPFRSYRGWQRLLVKVVSGPQAGGYAAFALEHNDGLTTLEYLESCRDQVVHPADDLIFSGGRSALHTATRTALSYQNTLTIQRNAGGTRLPANHFFMCGVNISSDNDVSYLTIADSPGDENDWGDAWRGQNQIGTLWSFANADYCCSGSHHIGNGAMEAYAGWKGGAGTPAALWHTGTYEIFVR